MKIIELTPYSAMERFPSHQETIKKRLAKRKWEIEQAQTSGRYQHTIINDNLDEAIEQLKAILTEGSVNVHLPGEKLK